MSPWHSNAKFMASFLYFSDLRPNVKGFVTEVSLTCLRLSNIDHGFHSRDIHTLDGHPFTSDVVMRTV